MEEANLKCSICGNEIIPNSIGWKYGNNSFPINEGRCCDECKLNIVLPRRMVDLKNEREVKENEHKNKR